MTEAATQVSEAPAEVATDNPATTQVSESVLGQAATNASDWTANVPEKFRTEDGVNSEAIYKSYSELESKLGKYGLPPESAEKYEYNYEPDESLPASLDGEIFDNLKGLAHTLGLSQKQFEPIAKGFEGYAKSLIEQAYAPEDPAEVRQQTESALKEVWKSDDELKSNMGLAIKAFSKYASDGINIDDVGNNPAMIRLLAAIGKDLGEDKGAIGGGDVSGGYADYETLMFSPAFINPHHRDHARVKAQVQAFEDRGFRLKR